MSVRSVDDKRPASPALPPTLFRLRDLSRPQATATVAASTFAATADSPQLAASATGTADTPAADESSALEIGSAPVDQKFPQSAAGFDPTSPRVQPQMDTAEEDDDAFDDAIGHSASNRNDPSARRDPHSLRGRLSDTNTPRGWVEVLASNKAIGVMLVLVIGTAYWTGVPPQSQNGGSLQNELAKADVDNLDSQTVWLGPEEVDAMEVDAMEVDAMVAYQAERNDASNGSDIQDQSKDPNSSIIAQAMKEMHRCENGLGAPATDLDVAEILARHAGNAEQDVATQTGFQPFDSVGVVAAGNPTHDTPPTLTAQSTTTTGGTTMPSGTMPPSGSMRSTDTQNEISSALQNMMRQPDQGLDASAAVPPGKRFRESATPNGVSNWLKYYPDVP